MRYEPLPSFDRSLKALAQDVKKRTKETILVLVDFFETGQKASGLGLKKLTGDLWQIRVDIRLRVVFRIEGDLIQWGFVGDHNQIKRFIEGYR